MRQPLLGTLTFVALVVSACTAQKKEPPRSGPRGIAAQAVVARPDALERAETRVLLGGVIGGAQTSASQRALQTAPSPSAPARDSAQMPGERKLLRRGDMTVEVRSVTAALDKLGQIIGSVGGHTANRSERQNEYGGRTASVTCRVPADRLDAAVEAMKALGRPRALTLTAEDVTTDYFDVSVRINTQTQLERQLVALLQRPTNKLAELLEIERELARVREEIDRLEGRRRLWDNQAALSSLVITLEEPASVVAGTRGGLLRTLAESFGAAAENFVLAVTGIIAATGFILPVAVLVGAVGWIAARLWRRLRAPAAPAV